MYCPPMAILPSSCANRAPSPCGIMIVAVLVVIVMVNAQLTWWIVFILGLNRENLDLERRRLLSRRSG